MGECPLGSKWNSQRLRCDDPRNIATPCKISSRIFLFHFSFSHLGGLRNNKGISLSHQHSSTILITFFSLLTFQQIVL
jgi:hypothetical protein